jgi:cellulose synthase (UDP-forming)
MRTLIESQSGNNNRRDHLVNVLTTRQSAQLRLLIGLWLIATIAFFLWWLQPAHWPGLFRFAVNSFILAWNLIIPGYYFYFLSRMKKLNPTLEIPSSRRIAMITARAPSEPFAQVKQTLLAMKAQLPPHDEVNGRNAIVESVELVHQV